MTDQITGDETREHYLSRIVQIDEMSAKGLTGSVEADNKEKEAIAAALDLVGLQSLTFSYRLLPAGKSGCVLGGNLQASFTQHCVISLEPLETSIVEDISLEFLERDELARLEVEAGDESVNLELDGPEPFENGIIDVGQLAYELFASALDPYPRKKDISFQNSGAETGESAGADSPFAVLKGLVRGKN